jgi:hypothetical protein
MPGDYKYEHISSGRVKALQRAHSEIHSLYKEMAESGMIAPPVLERLRVIRALVGRAANQPGGEFEIELLEKMFGKDMGEERQ